MKDDVISIGNSILQHGKYNDRIYLMKLSKDDFPEILEKLDELASDKGYSKIIAKVPGFGKRAFSQKGYVVEASIPRFYRCSDDVYFMGKYFNESRMHEPESRKIKEILKTAELKAKGAKTKPAQEFSYKVCDKSDASRMAKIYQTVFDTYPFPIHDPRYIMKGMDENFVYFSVLKNNRIVALSASEMDLASQNAEMTDFATLPEYRGNGFSTFLLQKMESEMKERDIKIAYTIARATSYSINVIFAKMGYNYSGTLLNNTNIAGKFEGMNVWFKFL